MDPTIKTKDNLVLNHINYLNETTRGGIRGIEAIKDVDEQSTNIDEVNIFAKLMKKADDAAQAGL